ncbi:MAG: hypothetical protein KKB20_07830, partial [Proteobacteria bacterium]|nr:hypothetical protein [Pseudomonadota bacterium]
MRTTRRLFLGLIVAALAATLAIPAPLQAKLIKKVDGFELLVDLSESMGHELKTADGSIIQTGEPPKQGYFKLFDYKKGKTKFQVEYELLQMINESVPSLDYQAALRTFGYRIAFYTGHYTTLNWGVALFDRTAMGQAIAPLENALALSPLGYGMAAASEELAAMPRRKALLIFSDFQWSEYFGDPVGEAEKLKTKYGPDLCVYTFYFDPDPEKVRIAREIVKAAGCGKAYDTFKLRTDPDAFQDMIRDIFY